MVVDPTTIGARLAGLRPGTRVRLFHRDGADRLATSGTLIALDQGRLTIAPDRGGQIAVAISAVTCFYVPKLSAGSFAVLRAALHWVVSACEPVLLARLPNETPMGRDPLDHNAPRPRPGPARAAKEPAAPALKR
jgi:hypothetical protein